MDIGKLMGMFGFGADDLQEVMDDPDVQNMMQSEQMQQLLQSPGLSGLLGKVGEIAAQGGIMPDDMDSIVESTGGIDGLLAGVGDLFGSMGFDEIDLDEETENYEPEAVDAGDRAFVTELKAWLKDTLTDIPAQDVCMLEIGYHLGYSEDQTPGADLWLAYNTTQTDAENRTKGAERWNFANWTDNYFRSIDDEPLTEWRESQGYELEEDDGDMTRHIYDLAVLAVMELHKDQFTEQRFGHKVPFIIEDYEYNQKTAIRAVKANGGKELFDKEFFSDCGFEDDEEEQA